MTIYANGIVLNKSPSIRLLGVHFACNNRFVRHIKIKLNKAKKISCLLNRIFKSKLISTKVKSNVYKCYIRPNLTFGSLTWFKTPNSSSHQIEIIRTFERRILRATTNMHRPRGQYKYPNSTLLY